MKELLLIIKEHLSHFGIIMRLARYEDKATNQGNYLGMAWQFLNPAFQVGTYYLVFGLGLRSQGNPEAHVPYIVWMLFGLSTWFFMNGTFMAGVSSITSKVAMVSKMKFPISILPTVRYVSDLTSFWAMLGISIVAMLVSGVPITLHILQFFYYFIAMTALMFSFGILNSTVNVLIPDYKMLMSSVMRLLFWTSGAIWNVDRLNGNHMQQVIAGIIKLNPFYYIVDGMRDSFLSQAWFWSSDRLQYTIMFWLFVMFIALLGSHLHMKFRARFIDLI
ncbi:teichoic acid transport system permease protein [Weissella beninensis]|uniref:ABC transporter permease n=2 Tax=Periweissella beninensis TaxID=504936 RepID=A0ABT0VFR2_9LACO|nr:teichoic acid transport system permease protein [Periweissella beninensis]MCM2436668.1 ABC transporter permease [Periweissella beninensis]MCT4395638.1 ABC transporter permease [Periweissella beninensis]